MDRGSSLMHGMQGEEEEQETVKLRLGEAGRVCGGGEEKEDSVGGHELNGGKSLLQWREGEGAVGLKALNLTPLSASPGKTEDQPSKCGFFS